MFKKDYCLWRFEAETQYTLGCPSSWNQYPDSLRTICTGKGPTTKTKRCPKPPEIAPEIHKLQKRKLKSSTTFPTHRQQHTGIYGLANAPSYHYSIKGKIK